MPTEFPDVEAAYDLIPSATALVVTDPAQIGKIKEAKERRLNLRDIRCGAERARKTLKEDSLRTSQAIDRVAAVIREMTEPAEAHLLEQETFVERQVAALIAETKAKREPLLRALGSDPSLYAIGIMPEDDFQGLLAGLKAAKEKREEEARKVEEARAEAERQRALEIEQARAERKRLEDQMAAERRKAAEERAASDAKLREERAAREKLEREAAERKAAEEKQAKAEAAAKRKAARAPDRVKLISFSGKLDLLALELPTCTDPEGVSAVNMIRRDLAELRDMVVRFADSLT